MADDADMRIKRDPSTESFTTVAREEFNLSAKAFFAPLVGAVWVMRELFHSDETPRPPLTHHGRRQTEKERERDAA